MALLNGIWLLCSWARLWMNALLSTENFVKNIARNPSRKRKIIGEFVSESRVQRYYSVVLSDTSLLLAGLKGKGNRSES